MQLLVSDYDGTLNPSCNPFRIRNLQLNIDAIREFRDNGNKFMISTGRTLPAIRQEIEEHRIPFDYLACNDGSILFDQDYHIVESFYIDSDVAREIVSQIFQTALGEVLCMFDYSGMTQNFDNVLELELVTKLTKFKSDYLRLQEIVAQYPELDIMNFFNINYIKLKDGKSRTIRTVEELIHPDEVVTVGDNLNDLDMLLNYDGYKMPISNPSLFGHQIPTVSSVHKLIQKKLQK